MSSPGGLTTESHTPVRVWAGKCQMRVGVGKCKMVYLKTNSSSSTGLPPEMMHATGGLF